MADMFVGRSTELFALDELAERAVRNREPAAATIRGEPGSGKTRLLEEARIRTRMPEAIDLVGYEPERRIPLSAARPLLQRLRRDPEWGPDLERVLLGSPEEPAPLDALQVFEAAHRAFASLGPTLLTL